MATFRQLTKADLPAYGDLCAYCFEMRADRVPVYMKWVARSLPQAWGAFAGKRLLAGMWYYRYSMRVGMQFLPMGGVAAVATAPEARSGGLARGLMLHAHRQMRQEGTALAALRPFKHAFYARMGYGDTFFYQDASFPPEKIAQPSSTSHTIRVIDGLKEWRLLEKLRMASGTPYFGTVKRDRAYWSFRILNKGSGICQCYLVESGKEPAGYVITELKPEMKSGEKELFVVDAAWRDQGALDAILRLLLGHRDQMNRIRWYCPADARVHDLMIDPQINVRLIAKMMLKLVDVKVALESRASPETLDGEVFLDLQGDETSPWNTGHWAVRWRQGKARVTRLRGALPRHGVLRIDSANMAILYSGRVSAEELRDSGRLVGADDVCRILDLAFPRTVPNLEEWF